MRRKQSMWRRLKETHPWLYEVKEWVVLAIAAAAFLLALAIFWERWF